MLEPLIVLTVLNCIFMFSSTVTTCALWWQYQSHRCCRKRAAQKSDLKRSKSDYIFRTVKKPGKSELDVTSKSNTIANREHRDKICQKKRSKKSLRYLAEYQKKKEKKLPLMNESNNGTLEEEKIKMSEASQTVNDAKSTVVMEFSTVQKVVQIVDNDSNINPVRAPFKDIVIQKDTDEKKYDYNNTEQNFITNVATNENS